ncbi:hypothetical protein H336_23015 [Vibrio parahaemolyticus EN9701072]|nr:hypothetical protein H336_23015 [Vibrio parahaemolyticus EN9701072]
MGQAMRKRMPVANNGGIVDTATSIANQVVPQIIQTEKNNNIVSLFLDILIPVMKI